MEEPRPASGKPGIESGVPPGLVPDESPPVEVGAAPWLSEKQENLRLQQPQLRAIVPIMPQPRAG